jgi:hypothetical protein
VQGLPGVQFALPEAVERLREWTRPDTPGVDEALPTGVERLVLLNATDPANLFGPTGMASVDPDPTATEAAEAEPDEPGGDPGRFMRIPANYVVLLRGKPVLLLESGGQRLTIEASLPLKTQRQALKLVMAHAGLALRRVTIDQCNGQLVLESPAALLLEEVGFRREALVYVWD